MLYREITAVCSEIHTKHINTLCGQNVELLNVKPGGTDGNHRALNFISVTSIYRHDPRKRAHDSNLIHTQAICVIWAKDKLRQRYRIYDDTSLSGHDAETLQLGNPAYQMLRF